MDINVLLSRLDKVIHNGKGRHMARCPAHADGSPSLQITQKDNRILIHCFAGCGANDVLDAINLDYSVLYPDGHEHSYKPIKLDDQVFKMIYQQAIKNREQVSPEDHQRYRKIMGGR